MQHWPGTIGMRNLSTNLKRFWTLDRQNQVRASKHTSFAPPTVRPCEKYCIMFFQLLTVYYCSIISIITFPPHPSPPCMWSCTEESKIGWVRPFATYKIQDSVRMSCEFCHLCQWRIFPNKYLVLWVAMSADLKVIKTCTVQYVQPKTWRSKTFGWRRRTST